MGIASVLIFHGRHRSPKEKSLVSNVCYRYVVKMKAHVIITFLDTTRNFAFLANIKTVLDSVFVLSRDLSFSVAKVYRQNHYTIY